MRRYMISVLAYYRSEWTDVSDDDNKYRLMVTEGLEDILFSCLRANMNIPNAAKEVEIFLSMESKNRQPTAADDRVAKNGKKRIVKNDKHSPEGSAGENPPEGV